MKIQYFIDPGKRLITETYPEKISIEDYQQLKQSEFNHPDFDPNYNIIHDLRSLKMGLNEIVIDKIINFIKENPKNMTDRKSALLTNSPDQAVNTMVFSTKADKLPINFKIFSTPEAAFEWFSE